MVDGKPPKPLPVIPSQQQDDTGPHMVPPIQHVVSQVPPTLPELVLSWNW